MKKKIAFYAIFILLQVVIVFGLGEIVVRLVHPQTTYSELKKLVGSYYEPSPFNTFHLKPNYRGQEPSQQFPGTKASIAINALGLRGKETTYNKPEGVKRILILGDSYAFGLYVNNEETYPFLLEEELLKKGYKVEVLNAGYADGHDTDQEYVWLLNEGLKYHPDVIILGFFHGNDVMGIREKYWQDRDKQGLPKKYYNPDIYLDDGRIRSHQADNKTVGVESIYRIPLLRESHLLIGVSRKLGIWWNSALASIIRMPPVGYSAVYYPQLFGKSAERFYQKYYGKNTEQMDTDFSQQEMLFKRLVIGMKDTAEANGAKFIILQCPANFVVDPEQFLPINFKVPDEADAIKAGDLKLERDYDVTLKPFFDQAGIPTVSLLQEMQKTPGAYFPPNGEVHMNPAGHALTARVLSEYLETHYFK